MNDRRTGTAAGRVLLLVTVLGSGMALLDATVVNVALARIGTSLNASFAGLQWTVNGYTLTLASLILLGGSLGDRFGRKRIFLLGVAWFAVASLLCGLAPNVEVLVAARALQGVGGALLTPGSLALISSSFVAEDRGAAIGTWSGLGGVAAATGPFLGGWLVQVASWRAVFLLNLPVAAAILLVASHGVPESRDPEASLEVDWPGIALGILGLGGLTYALVAAGTQGARPLIVSAGAVGVAALVGFVVMERRSRHPLVPPDLFASRQFTAANAATFAVYAALGGVLFLLAIDLQIVAGYTPLRAGTAILPVPVVMFLLSARMGRLASKVGPRAQMTLGPLVCAAGLSLLPRIGAHPSYVLDVLGPMLIFALGLATLVAPLTSTVLGAASPRHAGIASGVNNAVARAAGLLAVAVLPTLAGLHGTSYREPLVFSHGFRVAVWICVGLLVAGSAVSGVLIRNPRTDPVAV